MAQMISKFLEQKEENKQRESKVAQLKKRNIKALGILSDIKEVVLTSKEEEKERAAIEGPPIHK